MASTKRIAVIHLYKVRVSLTQDIKTTREQSSYDMSLPKEYEIWSVAE
jgi:hypothetical protein